MAKMTLGWNGYGKYLKPILLLGLVLLLMWSSVIWAGPMGDPEPVGADDPQAPSGSQTDPEASTQEATATVSDVELAIILVGTLL